MIWEEYNVNKHKEIDSWNKLNKNIDKYAMFDETLSETAKWYQNNKMGKISDKIMVISDNDIIVGFIILNISIFNGNLCITINPIVSNPNNKGFAEKILRDLFKNYNSILKLNTSDEKVIFTAGISESNLKCKELFLKLGFYQTGLHEDKTFGYYKKVCENNLILSKNTK